MNARQVASVIRKAAREYYGQRVRIEIGIRQSDDSLEFLARGVEPLVANQLQFAKGADLWSTVTIEEALRIAGDEISVMDGYVYGPGPDGELITNCDIWIIDSRFAGLLDSVGNSKYTKQLAKIMGSTVEYAEAVKEILDAWKR